MSLTKEEERQFFATKPGTPIRMNMGGKRLALANFPKDARDKAMRSIADRDGVMAIGQAGILPGLKINGKQVTRDNIHEFEIPAEGTRVKEGLGSSMKKTVLKPKKEKSKPKVKSTKFTESDLKKFSFSKLKELAKKVGETGRSKAGLINDILKHK